MTQTTKLPKTFEEYLRYNDNTDKKYEFVGGELVEMPPESPLNSRISFFLALQFAKFLLDTQICHKDTEIAVSGSQVQTRLPDLMILSEELAEILGQTNRGTIDLEMPPPELIIEVVSPGKTNEDKPGTACAKGERDYRFKRSEYAARAVPEYWAIDPEKRKITVYKLVDGLYEEEEYTGNTLIQSRFTELQLTTEQILNRKR
ncbi:MULTISPECIES: Uma2 family endonuclease [Nostocales]|uniref:Uma2 family endonuclease n=3 Tax=Nostocales TaxID=1161 RepID=A0A0C1MZX6_9CYAN|nr:Uma2 family endonuclease [Tolypothrix bouteillei]KAF3888613.1 Uma2 family endonuclease [Tolypothrix bouteillei VB521301]